MVPIYREKRASLQTYIHVVFCRRGHIETEDRAGWVGVVEYRKKYVYLPPPFCTVSKNGLIVNWLEFGIHINSDVKWIHFLKPFSIQKTSPHTK